jgi:hypothetical protein
VGCDVKTTLLALAFCFLPVIGNAEPNLKFALDNYEKSEANDKRVIESLLVATYVGMFWSTMQLQSEGKTPLFCQPSKVALTTEQILDMLRREVKETPPLADMPYGLAMLKTLEKVFPCNK